MQKPKITKQLAMYSAICSGVAFFVECCIAFFGGDFYKMRLFLDSTELTASQMGILCLCAFISCVPLGMVSLFGWLKKEITENSTMAELTIAPILYFLGIIGANAVRTLMLRIIATTSGAEIAGLFSYTASVQGWFSVLNVVALVLICCSASIERYIIKNQNAPSYGE